MTESWTGVRRHGFKLGSTADIATTLSSVWASVSNTNAELEWEGNYFVEFSYYMAGIYRALCHFIPSEHYHEGFAGPLFTHKETRTGRDAILLQVITSWGRDDFELWYFWLVTLQQYATS